MEKIEILKNYYELLGHKDLGLTEVRVMLKDKSVEKVLFFKSVEEFVSMDIAPDRDYYVGINPRQEPRPAEKADIKKVTTFVLDIDEPKVPAIEFYKYLPDNTVLISSGSGLHAYVPLEPFDVEDADTETDARKSLTEHYRHIIVTGGMAKKVDHVHDLTRIMRLPGSMNQKNDKPCIFLESKTIVRKPWRKLISFLPSPQNPLDSQGVDLTVVALDGNIKEVIARKDTYPSPSEAVFALVKLLIPYGLSRKQIIEFLAIHEVGTKDKDYTPDIERIIDKSQYSMMLKPLATYWEAFKKTLNKREPGFSTSIASLDRISGGIRRKELFIIGARPGSGKTTLVVNFVAEFLRQGLKVLMFPTEMGFNSLIDKLVAIDTGINLCKFRDNVLSDADKEKIRLNEDKFLKYQFYISEISSPSYYDLRNALEKVKPDVLIIDFIQRCRFKDVENIPTEMSMFIREIKNLAKEFNCAAIACSQLNRMGSEESPSIQTLKGSGGLEEEGDLVLLIACDNKTRNPRPIMLKIEKAKYGELAILPVIFDVNYGRIYEKR